MACATATLLLFRDHDMVGTRRRTWYRITYLNLHEQLNFNPTYLLTNKIRLTAHQRLNKTRLVRTCAVFFDVVIAFDKVWYNSLVCKLFAFYVLNKHFHIKSLLLKHLFWYQRENSRSLDESTFKSVAQGTIFLPLLFQYIPMMCLKDLLVKLKVLACSPTLFFL